MKCKYIAVIILFFVFLSYGVIALEEGVSANVEVVGEFEVSETELNPEITGLSIFEGLFSIENRGTLIVLVIIGIAILIFLAIFMIVLWRKNKKLLEEKNLIEKENQEVEKEGEILGEFVKVIEKNKGKLSKKFNQNKNKMLKQKRKR